MAPREESPRAIKVLRLSASKGEETERANNKDANVTVPITEWDGTRGRGREGDGGRRAWDGTVVLHLGPH